MKGNPTCHDCGRRMVFVVMVLPGVIFRTWQCDCQYRGQEFVPPEVVSEIVRAREWEDGSVAYDLETLSRLEGGM